MKAQKAEKGPLRSFGKDFKEIRVDRGCWRGDEGTVYGNVEADADAKQLSLTTRNIFS